MGSQRALLAFVFLALLSALSAQKAKPNILMFIVDDLGWNDVSFNGAEFETPTVDKMAKVRHCAWELTFLLLLSKHWVQHSHNHRTPFINLIISKTFWDKDQGYKGNYKIVLVIFHCCWNACPRWWWPLSKAFFEISLHMHVPNFYVTFSWNLKYYSIICLASSPLSVQQVHNKLIIIMNRFEQLQHIIQKFFVQNFLVQKLTLLQEKMPDSGMHVNIF